MARSWQTLVRWGCGTQEVEVLNVTFGFELFSVCKWFVFTPSRGILEVRCCAMELWWASRPLGGTRSTPAARSRSLACIPSSLRNNSVGFGALWRKGKCCNTFFQISCFLLESRRCFPTFSCQVCSSEEDISTKTIWKKMLISLLSTAVSKIQFL